MKHSEIIFNIKNFLSRGVQSDDLKISDRQIAFIVNYYRAKLLKEDAQRHQGISSEDIQDLGKVELVQVDSHECCEINDCIVRTKLKIPATLELRNKRHGLTYVGRYRGAMFQETTYNKAQFDSYSKYTGKETRWFFKGHYIYIVNPPALIEFINIQGLFEDPQEANRFRTCDCPNGEACSTGYDYDYPMSSTHVDTIIKMMAQAELNLLLNIGQDVANNTKNDI